MCGIAGIIDFRGRPIERATLERFCDALAHRGPDDRGIWTYAADGFSAGLAHTRLAVIDPTPEGRQPMVTRDGACAVAYNGELYNYRDLGARLASSLRTMCDTEVVLEACREWGPAALARFDAMWALAFVDTARRCGHLSRDLFGIKPLFYAVQGERLVFASELPALMEAPGISREIDTLALDLYLHLGFIPHPYTIYRGVRKLAPGHVLPFDSGGPGKPEVIELRARDGHFNKAAPDSTEARCVTPPNYEDACRTLRSLITSAVGRQRVSDVPLGAFLSGGLDSSVIVAAMAAAGGEPVKTFSIGYTEHARYDETAYALEVAHRFGTDHHPLRLTFQDVLAAMEPALSRLGEPFGDSSLIPTLLVSRHAREHVTVALSGDGGDELFGGYWRYQGHHHLNRYARLPSLVRKGVIEPLLAKVPAARSSRRLDQLRRARKMLRAADAPDAMGRHLAWARWLDPATAIALIGAERAEAAWETIEQMYRAAAEASRAARLPPSPPPPLSASFPRDPISGILRADQTISLPADMLFKVDTASMAHSLEVRVPLLSADVVAFANVLPIEYKLGPGQGKRILRDAFRDVLPESILTRGKMGFEVPIGEFLRHELREMYESVTSGGALQGLGIRENIARALYDDHLNRREDHADLLWALLALGRWRRGS